MASGYMSLDTSHAAVGQHVPMVSPSFDAHKNHCLLFDYKVWVSRHTLIDSPAPRLEVYISGSNHIHSGWMLWTSNGTGEGHAQILISAQPWALQTISFVGIIGDRDSTAISVANILLNEGGCRSDSCAQSSCATKGAVSIVSENCEYQLSWW